SAARQGDDVVCVDPSHDGRPAPRITSAGSFNVYVDGKLMARKGDGTTCALKKLDPLTGTSITVDGAIQTGAAQVLVRGAMAARDYDRMTHGGYVVPSESRVKVGPPFTGQDLIALAVSLLKAQARTPEEQAAARALEDAANH